MHVCPAVHVYMYPIILNPLTAGNEYIRLFIFFIATLSTTF